jgi:D-serine deaminase-like pyridoxal phosphate-dependent protein
MDSRYRIADTSGIVTPALVIFRDIVEDNLDRMISIAGDVSRLRPHCKTHKTREVTQMELARGIAKHKCATFAEAEMLAEAGVKDIVLAYNLVGANIHRAVTFRQKYPDVRLAVTADHPKPIAELGAAMAAVWTTIDVLLDIDTGQHRTGIEPKGLPAQRLYRMISSTPGLNAAGFHVYDGHQHQKSREEREAAVNGEFDKVLRFRDTLVSQGFEVPKLVCGGTGSFPIYAQRTDPTIELSPGTCVFHDAGYSETFPDLEFTPAALLLTRVISRPTADRVTFDLGYKAVASDPPVGRRLTLPDIPDAEQVLQNEEHLVVKTAEAERFQPGDETLAIPRHVCPTCAMHRQMIVVAGGLVVDRWEVIARDRALTI